ncbi:MAG: SDR family NAD(P)-dependent oxidoreductase [Arhodomonas sp.]|nr:SDR family NAD(P)-dependent oxidoreductase [Arhodomonas sp.]
MTTRALILGSTSAIAGAMARELAAEGADLTLVARNPQRNRMVADDLRARGAATVREIVADLGDPASHQAVLAEAMQGAGGIDLTLLAYGVLPTQERCETDINRLLEQFRVNATSAMALLARLAPLMAARGGGQIGVLSSVAGDRGRRSNYAYGAAKAALTTFGAGLGARYQGDGVTVTVIRLGFVRSPMTEGLTLPSPLMSSPEAVAPAILKAIRRGLPTAYIPRRWWLVMSILRHLPEGLFRKLDL